ncbi:MAG TPA: ATP-binding protein [Thermoanaerobaculia bacterium]|jgi:nitrogen fixation/metabolism regulation signal transduction histidine kinase|nr:ATP-binding protein [Thermoanaerobaculia bacterium]
MASEPEEVAIRRRPRRIAFRGLFRRARPALAFEDRVLLLALGTGFPGAVLSLFFVFYDKHSLRLRLTVTLFVLYFWVWFALKLRDKVVRPLQTFANLLSALREGDFSQRAHPPREPDALAHVVDEVNAIGEVLREQRLGAVEAAALLHRVVAEVDVAVFAFDDSGKLRLVNRAGERLLGEPNERLVGRTEAELGLADLLETETSPVLSRTFATGPGRWEVRSSTFREGGLPHRLLVISDLSRTLREEERQAWKRLIRVLGHELNNSLAPIHSMASTLAGLLTREPAPEDWKEDMGRGLEVIGNRSEALIRFMAAYARLARLPPPQPAPCELSRLIQRTAVLETRLPVFVERGPEVTLEADPDQIEQLLINLIRNAVDAALLTGGGVGVGWLRNGTHVEVRVEDEGPGLSNTENLFVPFYTTKPGGTGIGLALSRQIAEAHGGTLTLENRTPEPGCEALLRLPL